MKWIWLAVALVASSCTCGGPDASITPNCEKIALGTPVSQVPNVHTDSCTTSTFIALTEYSLGPIQDVSCCKTAHDGGNPCAIDCQASGYSEGQQCLVGNSDEWHWCDIFVVNGQVEAVWVGSD